MRRLSAALGAALAAACGGAQANSEPFFGLLPPGGAGFGALLRAEPSLYRDDGRANDLTVLFAYDAPHFYVETGRAGLKLERERWRGELFVKRRAEGFPSDDVPRSMAGLGRRKVASDLGLAASLRLGGGAAYAELMRDAGDTSRGAELRLGYRYEGWWHARLGLRPYVTAAYRDAKLNDYYYGVPGYAPGAGVDLELGAVARYRLSAHWQLLASVELTRASSAVRGSPVVEDATVPGATIGLLYGMTPEPAPGGGREFIVRVLHGGSSECILIQIVSLVCLDTHTEDPTDIAAVEIGRRLAERLNGWPVDLAAFIGLLHHDDKDLQPDGWQVNAYLKPYFYGFPWSGRVRTRLGLGLGVAYAERVPFSELRDLERRGRDTSKLLLYADPTLDVSVGDLLGVPGLREVFFGVGASHRSGVFGSSRVFNNVNGGSNYIYGYVETSF